MSFLFFDSQGEVLNGSKFEQISSDLINNQEVAIRVEAQEAASAPVIFLRPSSALGTVDFPSKHPSYADYNTLLVWGSDTTDENQAGQYGLYYKDDLGAKTYFSLTSGSNYKNGISLGAEMGIDDTLTITLGFTPKVADDIRRLYVGVEVYDAGTNI